MNLDLRPGRRCLVVVPPEWECQYNGHECTLIRFIGYCVGSRPDGTMLCETNDWWSIYLPSATRPAEAKHGYGARTPWLIPLPDDDEGHKMFGYREVPANVLKYTKRPVTLNNIHAVMHDLVDEIERTVKRIVQP